MAVREAMGVSDVRRLNPPQVRWQAALAVIGLAAILAVASELSTYATWGTVRPSAGPPPRIDWCGRRYYPSSRAISAEQVATVPDGSRLRAVASTPSGEPVLAAPMTAVQQSSYHTNICAMAVYVKVSADSYLPYGLSGGP
jgi:hypothetical protein